jgi:hypothetical protein
VPPRIGDGERIDIVPLHEGDDWGDDHPLPSPASFAPPPPTPRSTRSTVLGIVAALAVGAAAVWLVATADDTSTADPVVDTTVAAPTTGSEEPPAPVAVSGPDGLGTPGLIVPNQPQLWPMSVENPPLTNQRGRRSEVRRDEAGDRIVLVDAIQVAEGQRRPLPPVIDAVRVDVDGFALFTRAGQPDRVTTTIEVDDWVVTVEAVGVPMGELVPFLASARTGRLGPTFDAATLPDLTDVTSRPFSALTWLTGAVTSTTAYWSSLDDEPIVLQVGIRDLQTVRGIDDVLLRNASVTDWRVTGELAADPTTSVSQWRLPDGRVATATGRMSVDTLSARLAGVRPASAAEWAEIADRASYGAYVTTVPVAVGSIGSDRPWRAGVEVVSRFSTVQFRWWWGSQDHSGSLPMPPTSVLSREPVYTSVSFPNRTYVLVRTPIEYGATTVLVRGEGMPDRTAVVVPIPETKDGASVIAITEPGPFEVFAIDPSGQWVRVPVLSGR